MNKKNILLTIFIVFISSVLILSACSSILPGHSNGTPSDNQYEKLVKEKNKQFKLAPLTLTSYSDELGVTFSQPKYKRFAVNGKVTVEAKIEKHAKLTADYAWIKVEAKENGPAGNVLEYYTPINNGKFKQDIHFFNGEGEYEITVNLPSSEAENYFYDTAIFHVINVNPTIQRDVTYTPAALKAGLSLELDSSYLKKAGVFSLKGAAENLIFEDYIMVKLIKDTETWEQLVPVKNGRFSYDIPLFYGPGVHEIQVMVPEGNRKHYYQLATTILIDNESGEKTDPIQFFGIYTERGITLDSPVQSGAKADTLFNIRGSIDPTALFARETTHLYITTQKGSDKALEVIPIKNFAFDGSFHLRFGPGVYEVTLSVPEVEEKNRNYFSYYSFAQFEVESHATKDLRNLLPSRGVQSDSPQIKSLAAQITNGKGSIRNKAKAIYEYVAKNIAYDLDKAREMDFEWDDSALKTLQLKKGVCQDYAYLTIALLRASGIEARFIEGYAGERHAWVEAKLDGSWITMDPTWGAGYVQNNQQFVKNYNEAFFDPNMTEFNQTHTRTKVAY